MSVGSVCAFIHWPSDITKKPGTALRLPCAACMQHIMIYLRRSMRIRNSYYHSPSMISLWSSLTILLPARRPMNMPVVESKRYALMNLLWIMPFLGSAGGREAAHSAGPARPGIQGPLPIPGPSLLRQILNGQLRETPSGCLAALRWCQGHCCDFGARRSSVHSALLVCDPLCAIAHIDLWSPSLQIALPIWSAHWLLSNPAHVAPVDMPDTHQISTCSKKAWMTTSKHQHAL